MASLGNHIILGNIKMKKIAILQSNYIPWKGYFDMMAAVDEFIIYDDVQYTTNDWRNRNLIKTPNGTQWCTVPVQHSGRFGQLIRETEIRPGPWAVKHWKNFAQFYGKAPYFKIISEVLAPFYLEKKFILLSDLNEALLTVVANYLNLETTISHSSDYVLEGDRNERILSLCRQAGADVYISGKAAQHYLNVELFKGAGVEVRWFDYEGFPIYNQLWGDFIHQVSIVDLLFNCGPNSPQYLRHARA
jgi:hypothetical protein